jgi:hypothetical protein
MRIRGEALPDVMGPDVMGMQRLRGMPPPRKAQDVGRMTGDGMRALKVATVVMGILIVLGTVGLVVGIVCRSSSPAPVAAMPAGFSALLQEPEGTRITGIAALQDRLAIQLQGGGADRVVLVDPRTGAVLGRIALNR